MPPTLWTTFQLLYCEVDCLLVEQSLCSVLQTPSTNYNSLNYEVVCILRKRSLSLVLLTSPTTYKSLIWEVLHLLSKCSCFQYAPVKFQSFVRSQWRISSRAMIDIPWRVWKQLFVTDQSWLELTFSDDKLLCTLVHRLKYSLPTICTKTLGITPAY